MGEKGRKRRETFGAIRELPSGRFQASYVDPLGRLTEGGSPVRHTAPRTFDTLTDARGWLNRMRVAIEDNKWSPVPVAKAVPFGTYAAEWIKTRQTPRGDRLRPSTVNEYVRLLKGPLAVFQGDPLASITAEKVRHWNADQKATGALTQSARAYALLKAIMATAVEDGYVSKNPCGVRGAVKAATGKKVSPPTEAELATIVETMDPRFRLLVQIAAWGSLRWGEVTELRRGDVVVFPDEDGTRWVVLEIRRAVTYTTSSGFVVGQPKSAAGVRSVTLPPTLTAAVEEHLSRVPDDPEALLFPSAGSRSVHLSAGSFSPYWRIARGKAKRPDMPFHALRHFGATRFAQAGATLREIQERLGHSTVTAAMRYQHTAGRDAELARRMAGPGVPVT